MKRYPAILPNLDQRPIERAQKQILAPAADNVSSISVKKL
jgi:hypothetical protein